MTPRVLCVDDDANLLAAFRRHLRGSYLLDTAPGGQEGLELIRREETYAVIVADLRMPGMDGIEFLSQARALSPDSVRIMLTGHADLQAAIDVVNEGMIFRFLTKPCSPRVLRTVLDAAAEQYRLIVSERELLEKTLKGSIKVLSDVLSLASPVAFARASRLVRLLRKMAPKAGMDTTWKVELAGMLSQLGCLTLPADSLERIYCGEEASMAERQVFEGHPRIGADLLSFIPRLEDVAGMIRLQNEKFTPDSASRIPLGARLLHAAVDYDSLVMSGRSSQQAAGLLRQPAGHHDPRVLDALEEVVKEEAQMEPRQVRLRELAPGMILNDHVRAGTGLLLVAKGQEVTRSLKSHLLNFDATMMVRQPIHVLVPLPTYPESEEAGE